MKQFFRITAAVLAAAFLLALTGCGSSSSAPSFTWFVDTIPANLDPQVASAAPDVIACENLYSGLVRKKADGEIVPDLSESWTISSDGKTYTFQIKDGLTYKAVKGASTDGRAMSRRSAYHRQASSIVYALVHSQCLERCQPLVVIHGQDTIKMGKVI